MPYKSRAQRRFMRKKHPRIAARWDKEYGSGGDELPERKGARGHKKARVKR